MASAPRHFALSAIGRDRPGIVAAITRDLLAHAVNVEDSQMAILSGHFTMLVILSAPAGLDTGRLRAELEETGEGLGLEAVSLSEIEDAGSARPEPSHLVTVYGADHPGIVHAAAAALAGAGVNITDVSTRLLPGDGAQPVYVMLLEVTHTGGRALEDVLRHVRDEQGVEVRVRELELDAL